MTPGWLDALAKASVAGAFFCAAMILGAIWIRPQKMSIMNVVWPVTALYWGPVTLWSYRAISSPFPVDARQEHWNDRRQMAYTGGEPSDRWKRQNGQGQGKKPFWAQTAVGVSHCGAGCTLGDIAGEWMVFAFGWKLFGDRIYAQYFVDFGLAFMLGIAFQYFSIAPMRGLGLKDGLIAAVKADTVSIIAFEIGLFAWMAVTRFVLFRHENTNTWNHWFMMQIGMIISFFTSYPANWLLLRQGLKEAM